MNRATGFSTIGMAMMLLLPGTLMLGSLQRQLSAHGFAVASESHAIRAFAQAEAALAWATYQRWQPDDQWQCRAAENGPGRTCIRRTDKHRVMLAGQSGTEGNAITLWQAAILENGSVSATSHGWSDFCPFREVGKCTLP